ncbi:MAG: phosphate acyltransferase PlsX [Candidatus Dormibacteraeota bacterium]|nr:phosphate acyltransferase PlsX [Candidatus Dormibacteraeota bacterium]
MTGRANRIAVDAMGGDHAPEQIVRGAIRATRELGVAVTLVGKRDAIEPLLRGAPAGTGDIEIVDAGQVVDMGEHPANAVRSKPDSSVVRACKMVADGQAAAAVSAGNSGATLAAALLRVKRIPGVARPAIGTSFPTRTGHCFMLDVGANSDSKPEWLAQFAVMGDIYAQSMLGIEEPRVGLLSNGEEAEKGSELVRATRPLLEALPLRFAGNVEGKDIFRGQVDVVVTDGFTGNIALKMAEGVGEFLFASISRAARSTRMGTLGGALLKPSLRPLRDTMDYRKTGGALMLGVNGEVVIAHGRSDAEAIVNAIRVAAEAVARDISGGIAKALKTSGGSAGDGEETEPGNSTSTGAVKTPWRVAESSSGNA